MYELVKYKLLNHDHLPVRDLLLIMKCHLGSPDETHKIVGLHSLWDEFLKNSGNQSEQRNR